MVYLACGLGFPPGVWVLLGWQSWRLYVGPLLMAAWSAFGAYVDLLRPRPWRVPIDWSVSAPFLVLSLSAQMFLWWPLWTMERAAWAIYLVLFIPSTILNVANHREDDPGK